MNVLLDKSIKALGGRDKLSEFKAAYWKAELKLFAKSRLISFTREVSATQEMTGEGLLRYDTRLAGGIDGTEFQSIGVLNGNKG